MASTLSPDFTISIVSYNTREMLRTCLESLRACQEEGTVALQTIVVDNNSTDGSAEMVQSDFPDVEVLQSGANIGYGRANNLAFEKARGRYFFILNSDTEVTPQALQEIFDFLSSHPAAGAAGAQLILPDGSLQVSWAREPGLLWVICEQTFLDRLPFIQKFVYGLSSENNLETPQEVDQVCGAALIVRREVYKQLGGFDPAFFMYYEDTDLCIRIREASHKIYYLPQARISHHLGGSSQTAATRARMIASYNQSRYYYFNRHQGKGSAVLLKLFVLIGALLRLGAWSALALGRPQARSQVRLFRDVLRRTSKMSFEASDSKHGR